MSVLFLKNYWKMVDGSPLPTSRVSIYVIPLPSGHHCFWWKVSCSIPCVCDESFFSFCFQDFLLIFVLKLFDYAGSGYGSLCLSNLDLSWLNFWICSLIFFKIKYGKTSAVIFWIFFCSFLFLLPFWYSHYTLVVRLWCITFLRSPVHFLNSFPPMFFTLYDYYWSIFKFTDFFLCVLKSTFALLRWIFYFSYWMFQLQNLHFLKISI